MQTSSRTALARRGLRALTAGTAVFGLVGLGVAVVPQAGATAAQSSTGAARSTTVPTSTRPCTGCLDRTIVDFEDGDLAGWHGTNGATVSVGRVPNRSDGLSLAVDDITMGSGAAVTLTSQPALAYFGLSVMVEPIPILAEDGTIPYVKSTVLLTLQAAGREPIHLTTDIGEGGWTRVGTWAPTTNGEITLDLTVLQSCDYAIGRTIYIDDVQTATFADSGAHTQTRAAAAPTTQPTLQPTIQPTTGMRTTSAGTVTSTITTTTSTTHRCIGSTEIPKVFSFENGKRDGWKPLKGVSAKVVTDPSALDGEKSLELKGTKVGYAGLTWTGSTRAFPGTGTWYHVSMPVRGPHTTFTPAGDKATLPQVMLSVSGPIARATGGIATVPLGGWTTIDLWFMLDDSVGTKPAKITLTLGPAPQPNCGTPPPLATQLGLDAIAFTHAAERPVTTQAVVRPMC